MNLASSETPKTGFVATRPKYDKVISLTAAAESPLTYHHHELAPSTVCFIVDLAQGDDSKYTPIVMIVAVVGVFQLLFSMIFHAPTKWELVHVM